MSIAVTIKKIDEALVARYQGIIWGGSPIPVFMEYPDPDEFPERKFPSISLRFLSMEPAYELFEGVEEQEEVALDISDPTKPIRTMRAIPIPYLLNYSLETWNRGDQSTSAARDLLMAVLVAKTHPRGWMEVTTIDNQKTTVWVFLQGNIVSIPEVNDSIIQHQVTGLDVLAFIDPNSIVYPVKASAGVEYGVYGNPVNKPSNLALDIRFVITEDGVKVIE